MTNPRDPLTTPTLSTPIEERIESSVPVAYRLKARRVNHIFADLMAPPVTAYTLQGAFKTWDDNGIIFHEWRDIPTVIED